MCSAAQDFVPRSSLSKVQGYPQDGQRWRMKKDRERDRERDKEIMPWGDQASVSRPVTLFSERAFIP